MPILVLPFPHFGQYIGEVLPVLIQVGGVIGFPILLNNIPKPLPDAGYPEARDVVNSSNVDESSSILVPIESQRLKKDNLNEKFSGLTRESYLFLKSSKLSHFIFVNSSQIFTNSLVVKGWIKLFVSAARLFLVVSLRFTM
jgi:preprotein translocase subunit SecF